MRVGRGWGKNQKRKRKVCKREEEGEDMGKGRGNN